MQVVGVKISVIFGLLFTTFGAACLPLVLLLGYAKKASHKHAKASESLHRMRTVLCCSPCFSRSRNCNDDKTITEEHLQEEVSSTETISKNGRFRAALNVMNCFSGGVFLGTSFLALMPEIREIFDEVGITWPQMNSGVANTTSTSDDTSAPLMPITEILVTSGLFLILCIEQGVHSLMEFDKHADKKPSTPERRESDDMSMTQTKSSVVEVSGTSSPLSNTIETKIMANGDLQIESCDPVKEQMEEAHHNDSAVRSAILVAILSVHSVLEGLAIGLQNNASSALSIFVAVLFHKSLMSFSMGNNLLQSGQSARNILIASAVLAVMSPTGISIGIVMKETNSGTEIIHGILQGIATGTFLFITFFEVLSKEFSNHANRISKTIAFVLGYLCILGVMFAQNAA